MTPRHLMMLWKHTGYPTTKRGLILKSKAITNATIDAAKAPLNIMEASLELLHTLANQVESVTPMP